MVGLGSLLLVAVAGILITVAVVLFVDAVT
jgi:hypothetical protein